MINMETDDGETRAGRFNELALCEMSLLKNRCNEIVDQFENVFFFFKPMTCHTAIQMGKKYLSVK